LERTELRSALRRVPEEKFAWFAVAALVLLAIELILPIHLAPSHPMKPSRPSVRPWFHPRRDSLLAHDPAVGGVFFVTAERKRRRALRQMAGERGEEQGLIRERRAEFFCSVVAGGFLILAIARPTWKDVWVDTSGAGRDVVFLLDVSRSMLGTDAGPNRLESAKTAIRDCVKTLQGDRVALVAFSGSASIRCPLTSDLAFFYDKLEEAHPDFIPAGEVRVGGTRIGDAIRKTTEKLFTADRKGFQDLILMTDGEDQQSSPEATVERLGHLGVYLIAIGIGTRPAAHEFRLRPVRHRVSCSMKGRTFGRGWKAKAWSRSPKPAA